MGNFVTISDLCDLLKVTRQTLNNWRKKGMPCEKFGKIVRFDKDKVYEWLKSRDERL